MKKILVPVDFSDYTNYVTQYAIGIAQKISGEVILYHAYLDPTLGAPVPAYDFGTYNDTYTHIIDDTEKLEIEKLEAIYKKYKKELDQKKIDNIKLRFTIESGFPEEQILTYSLEEQTDLIAIGTRGNGGLMRDLFGSVTEKIVENANIPVLVVPEKSEFNGIKNVLYATDYKDSDLQAIEKLADIFSAFDININCVHVCFGTKEQKDLREMVKLKQKLRSEFKGSNIRCSIVESDGVLHGFEEFLSKQKIDIIALTTHKRNIFTKYLNPSFTRKFIFQSKLPLLVFHG